MTLLVVLDLGHVELGSVVVGWLLNMVADARAAWHVRYMYICRHLRYVSQAMGLNITPLLGMMLHACRLDCAHEECWGWLRLVSDCVWR